jgi:transposase
MSHKKINDTHENIDEIQRLYSEGFSIKKIADIFDVGETTMYRYFGKHNIATRTPEQAYELKRLTPEQEQKIWNLYYNSGLNREQIAEKLGYSQYSVRSVIDGNCLPGKQKLKLNYEKNAVSLTHDQKQLILGSLLGDAHLSNREHNGCSEQLEFGITHGEPQIEYIRHCAKILGSNISENVQGNDSFGAGNRIYKLSYFNKYELLKIASVVLINGRKSITNAWMKEIDSLALAYWFMDDGSSTYSNNKKTVTIKFATQSFNKEEHDILRNKLLDFGVYTTIQKAANGTNMNLYIRQKSVNKFMDIIEPHVLPIVCMNYKIKRKVI